MVAEDENKIAEEARKEYEAEKDPESVKTAEPEAKPEPKVVEPAKEEAEPPKTEDKPAEEPKSEPVKEEEKSDDEAVNAWALKNGITIEEAKEDLQKTKAVIEKYKTPEEIAKALRSTQSAFDKLRSEASKEKPVEVFRPVNPKLEVESFLSDPDERTKQIENYRNRFPAKSRDMEDDAIVEEVAEKLVTGFSQWQDQQIKAIGSQASQKREELIATLSESDRKFLPDIKAVIDKTADHALLSKGFNVVDVVRWAKGAKYDSDVKSAEERGYKRAKEEANIVGIISSGGKSTSVKSSASSGVVLNDYDKRRAKEMFGTTHMSEEDMYREYSELTKKKK